MAARVERGRADRQRFTLLLRLALALTVLAPWLLVWVVRRVHARQGADPARLQERLGQPSCPRPAGPLVWIHAASVGEVASVAALARAIKARTGGAVLLTTFTATGAETVARRVPQALHQFMPIDTPAAVAGFLTHWQPNTALFVEGDLWPRLLTVLTRRGVPVVLLNARASRSRVRFARSYAALLGGVECVTVQEDGLRAEFEALGLERIRIHAPGNLKADIDPPPVNAGVKDAILRAADGRGLWAAVSTHPGEEEIVLEAHRALPGSPLLLLVPRHPDRGTAIADMLSREEMRFSRQSSGEMPGPETQVHLVDLLGETGTVYAASRLAYLGGSLRPGVGGHTPFEPAALGCAILSGPYVANFRAAYQTLQRVGGALEIRDAQGLSEAVATLLTDPDALSLMQGASLSEQQRQSGATERTLEAIDPVLRRKSCIRPV